MLSSLRQAATCASWCTLGRQAGALAAALEHVVVGDVRSLCTTRVAPAAAATQADDRFYNIPAGHMNSDLTSSACHIGLGRRRDLTLRQDLKLHNTQAQLTLAEVFKGKKAIVVGFPGGKICTEKHLPGFVQASELLRQKGVDKICCVSVGDPSELQQSLQNAGLKFDNMFEVFQDKNGGFVRLLGLDLGDPDCGQGPKCQRYAAVVEDGILLKLQVEKSPRDLQVTDAASLSKLWDNIYA